MLINIIVNASIYKFVDFAARVRLFVIRLSALLLLFVCVFALLSPMYARQSFIVNVYACSDVNKCK